MEAIGENIWLQKHSFSTFGMQMGRNVVPIRLSSGKLIIHSTAPFSEEEAEEIRTIGEPGWILDPTNFHDTYAVRGAAAFPEIPFLAPEGFPAARKAKAQSLAITPAEWDGEIDVIPILGMPMTNEHVFFHPDSKTLIVADLLFNLPSDLDGFTRTSVKLISGIREYPGNSRMFRLMIRDREAFEASLQQILSLDFSRVIVGHGLPVETEAKTRMRKIFANFGYAV
ncbi:MAG: hypothetical protein P1U87_12540 [Verrucomicrobiales bacterium]|nr:hypothetical protein [Verrucomicrobiales bacterium]